jgi:hypothetical protein
VKKIWEHMRYYATIRKCCGTQASSLQRAVLAKVGLYKLRIQFDP